MAIATKCTCGYSITGVCTSSVKECKQLKKENSQLPKEVVKDIAYKADEVYNELNALAVEADVDNYGLPTFNKVKEPIEKALTAYATKLHQVETFNGLLKTEISHLNTVIESLKAQPGQRWVKASEFKTTKPIYRPYRRKRKDEEHEYDYGEIYVTEDNGEIFFDVDNERAFEPKHFECWKDYEILDEQPAAGKEEDAVSFAQWLATERWQPRINTEWARYETVYSDVSVKTTGELYKLYKQQKEK